jgi:hypothetical protein
VLVDVPDEAPARRSRVPLVLAGLAGVALTALVVSRLGGDGDATAPPAPPPPAAAEPRPQPYVVQPIPVPLPAAATAPRPTLPDAGPAPRAETTPAPRPRPPAPRPPRPAPVEPVEAPTAASVQAKYQATKRDYDEFRKRYGERLSAEWDDILSFQTYAAGEDKQAQLDAKLAQFRRRMAQIRAGN